MPETFATFGRRCFDSWNDAVYYGEIGISRAVLAAGYNIGSLMLRYQGVNFRDSQYHNCNGGHNPLQVNSYDGITVNPLEVMHLFTQ
jgi:hypothetical protein